MANVSAINTSSFNPRNMAMLRHYLKGKTYVAIGRGNGISSARVRQIITRLMRGVAFYMRDEGLTTIEHESASRSPRTCAAFWLKVIDRIESEKGFSSKKDRLASSAKYVPSSWEDPTVRNANSLLRSIDWSIRHLRGESLEQIAHSENLRRSTVLRKIKEILGRLETECANLNKHAGQKFILQKFPEIAARVQSPRDIPWKHQQLVNLQAIKIEIKVELAEHITNHQKEHA